MVITVQMKERLAQLIVAKISENFSQKYITHNLIDNINITVRKENVIIEIPAQMYSFAEWNRNRVIVPYGKGSYANLVNKTGGFSGTHKNYVEQAIDDALKIWKNEIKLVAKQNKVKKFKWKVTKS